MESERLGRCGRMTGPLRRRSMCAMRSGWLLLQRSAPPDSWVKPPSSTVERVRLLSAPVYVASLPVTAMPPTKRTIPKIRLPTPGFILGVFRSAWAILPGPKFDVMP